MLAAFVVGALTASLQSTMVRAGVVVILLTVVASVGVVGGGAVGAITGMSAALSFDFFHVEPARVLHPSSLLIASALFALVGAASGVKGSTPARSAVAQDPIEITEEVNMSDVVDGRSARVRSDVVAPLAALASLAVAAALVGVRGEISPAVTAVALAVVVSLAGRLGGNVAAVSSAMVAALSFDFLHTEPYLSLKISDLSDVLVTVLLLVVGLIVGGLAASRNRDRRRSHTGSDADSQLRRVLTTARASTAEDTQLAVRAELLGLLHLRDCWFTTDAVNLPVIQPNGRIDVTERWWTRDGFELPRDGVAVPAAAYGRIHGYLVCVPTPGVGVQPAERQAAVELGAVLGLVIGSGHAA